MAGLRHSCWPRLASLVLACHGFLPSPSIAAKQLAAERGRRPPASWNRAVRRPRQRASASSSLALPRGGSVEFDFDGSDSREAASNLYASIEIASHQQQQPSTDNSSSVERLLLWTIPLLGAGFSFGTFKFMSSLFHDVVQWASANTWFPTTPEEVNLQTSVVTQVVNGPVITSISVLFATLVSMTVSNLYARQVDIQASLIQEVHAIRRIQQLLASDTAVVLLNDVERSRLAFQFQRHKDQLVAEHHSPHRRGAPDPLLDPYKYVESNLLHILDSINDKLSERISFASTDFFLSQLQGLTQRVLHERSNRWLAMKALQFPAVHYVTLSLLALSIGVAFLVATDGAEFIFLHGLPVRILWTLLVTSFTALAVLCYDLSRPFGGAYRVVQ